MFILSDKRGSKRPAKMSYGFLFMLTMNAKQLNDVVVTMSVSIHIDQTTRWSSGN